jgi:DNA-directed RNA polymerase II subunit RPB1
MTSKRQHNDAIVSRVIGIQFSILSPEEIRSGSVAEITNRDTYINNKPVIGGLFDPRMGVQEPGLICPTDGLDYMKTPGYFGHIELARPVFYIQYINIVVKILRCVCVKCSKLLISKSKYSYLKELSPEKRWGRVFTLANKIKRCGECNEHGCGYKQPDKVRKENLATILAEWSKIEDEGGDGNIDKLSMQLTSEFVLKIFKRISDADVHFMGFSPTWSRPEWMICQVLAVPPPAVRPSIKQDAQQRSEDDITHIIVNIIKANKTLYDKIEQNAPSNVIDDWHLMLQYYVATQIDNNIPGVAVVAQRSGRPLKSIKERLNGKQGRVRGNLMGKRVDFSARSVITPDPNLSIRELGVPIKVAMNITKPIRVNSKNRSFLSKLVKNGPDEYPGAKILEKNNGESISLRYVDRISINLEDGDIVHRHMMDGDAVLFNRQPTLHRMSMMCHIAKIMKTGQTFRLNVGDTKPYNADFDGDEMNLHMPQDVEAESELRNLAAVPYQIISPANNKSIVGIFQDSLLGAHRFTRPDINFTPREAMNLLMAYPHVNIDNLHKAIISNGNSDVGRISSFDILSQIIPELSVKYKTKLFGKDEDVSTSNNVLEIRDGQYVRGSLEKGTLGDGTRGLLQRICNDFGNMRSSDFIDDFQNVITEYMKSSAYSVGISDLIASQKVNETIMEAITNKKLEVKDLIDQLHLGIFENKSGKANIEEFETRVNNILNQAQEEAGKLGRQSLNADNRFVIMVNAGSKGSNLNIAQMISCLGQQNVDGKRIPYGFDNRTLPHFTKFDDSPGARGFVESSFISGLTPTELFFHAMGGRVGLIDTAVKTSQTGYIQRRLVKGLEDMKVEYDMTVRNNKGKIIQYAYGDDCVDTVRVENQHIPIVNMTYEQIYAHFHVSTSSDIDTQIFTPKTQRKMKKQKDEMNIRMQQITQEMIVTKKDIIQRVFNHAKETKVHLPVSFMHIIRNIQGSMNLNSNSMVDITPIDTLEQIDAAFTRLEKLQLSPPTRLFRIMYYYYLSPRELLVVKRFNKAALDVLLNTIITAYKKALVHPGEMVGMISAQSIGEPTTQMTLNTFHFAGTSSKSNVTRGVPRIEEILSLSENPKNPSLTVYMPPAEETSREYARDAMNKLERTSLMELLETSEICFDPDDMNTLIKRDEVLMTKFNLFDDMITNCNITDADSNSTDAPVVVKKKDRSKWVMRLTFDKETMFDKNITMDDIYFAIQVGYKNQVSCVYSDYNSDELVMRIRLDNIVKGKVKKDENKQKPLDYSDDIYKLKNFQDNFVKNLVIRGVKNINNVIVRQVPNILHEIEGDFQVRDIWVLDTVGTNLLDTLGLKYIDMTRTFSNSISEVYKVLGIEAARHAIYTELADVLEFDGTYINYHHMSLLCDRMTSSWKMISIYRHGINNDNIGPVAKASFEETPEMLLRAARHAEVDVLKGVSANVMCGQEGFFGTNSFQVLLDMGQLDAFKPMSDDNQDDDEIIDEMFRGVQDGDAGVCTNTVIKSNTMDTVDVLKPSNIGDDDDDYELDGF